MEFVLDKDGDVTFKCNIAQASVIAYEMKLFHERAEYTARQTEDDYSEGYNKDMKEMYDTIVNQLDQL